MQKIESFRSKDSGQFLTTFLWNTREFYTKAVDEACSDFDRIWLHPGWHQV